jgi:PPP family 3-phenylpropionic acid transporter
LERSITALPAAQSYGWRIALFYGALFVIYGMHVPFTPLWLDWKGLTSGEISAVMAAPLFLRLFITPAVALAADRRGTHRRMLIVLGWMSVLFAFVLSQMSGFWPILVFAVALVICNSTIMPLTETIAVMAVRQAGLDYGRMRLWGSLTFVAASFLGGLVVQQYGGSAGIWLVATGCALTACASYLLPAAGGHEPYPMHAGPVWQAAEPRRLLASAPFRAFLVAAGTAQAAHATLLTFATLIWQRQGLSPGWAGALWAIGVLAEVMLFAVSGPLVARLGVVRLLIGAAALSVLRWGLMAFDPPLWALIPLQALHAMTYGGSHIAAIHFIHQAVPRRASGSAQALYATMASGLAMGCATLICGRVYASSGSAAAYGAMSVLSLISLAAAWRLRHSWDGANVIDEGSPDAAPAVIPEELPAA